MDFPYLIIAQTADGGGLMSSILMFGLIFLIFYVILIRPQKKELTRHQGLITSLKVGDEVVTTGGLIGKVSKVDGQIIHLEVARGTTIKLDRQKVHRSLEEFNAASDASAAGSEKKDKK